MFNLKSDLKVYTCDKYVLLKKIISEAKLVGDKYIFDTQAQIKTIAEKTGYRDDTRISTKLFFEFKGFKKADFEQLLSLAGINYSSFQDLDKFHRWAKNNPTKSWHDFERGTTASLA